MNPTSLPLSDVTVANKLGLLPEEFDKICQILGRTPNFTELSVYSVMWSEHCSYKNSILWLKKLPKTGARVLAAAGEENAGLIDIGKGQAVCFKIESHNHPSAIEPFQGAATGVGGIHRDIFTMGARPIATLNSLRLGDTENPKTRRLLRGIVAGISHYGNAFGVPTVGGELYFDPCYTTNPLVNVMSVGIVENGLTASATAVGKGHSVFIVGAATGKDGIHGATFASGDLDESSEEKLPSVQVGDPFTEKLLLEATLEAIAAGVIAGIQDMGAAGITCSSAEMSAKANAGMILHLDKVPLRETNMKPFEILLSESQERMLVITKPENEEGLLKIFLKWGIHCAKIGEVTDTGCVEYFMGNEKVGEIPAQSLVLGGDAPVYERTYTPPAYLKEIEKYTEDSIPVPTSIAEVAEFMLTLPNLGNKKWVTEQYDSMVGAATISTRLPSDAAILLLPDTDRALALTTDCNARHVWSNPRKGTLLAVVEAARNILCAGGEPLGVTNCLNFGNPYNPEVYWQFTESILGMKEACEKLHLPVTGGNVSFYNQSPEGPVFPSPVIGMVGLIESINHVMGLGFKSPEDHLWLLGPVTHDLAGSEYLTAWHKITHCPPPYFDWEAELALHKCLPRLIQEKVIHSAHDVADGGLWLCLLESAFASGLGWKVTSPDTIRPDAFWFGEGAGRVVVSLAPEATDKLTEICQQTGVNALCLGTLQEKSVQLNTHTWSLDQLRSVWENQLGDWLNQI